MVNTETRGVNRHVRLRPEQDEKLQALADAEGCSVSDIIRRALFVPFFSPLAPQTVMEQHKTDGGESNVSDSPEPANTEAADA